MKKSRLGDLLPGMKIRPPGPRSRQLCRTLAEYESPSSSYICAGRIPVVWAEAHGANIKDVDGNVYVDLTGAFCVAGVGHGNRRVVAAIRDQAGKLLHTQGVLNPSMPRIQLVKKLAQVTPRGLNKAILVNTGAEAVELALKTARIYTRKSGAIAFHGAFHGKTYGALAVTGRRHYRDPFLPLASGITHVPYAYCYRCPFEKTYPQCGLFCAKYLEYILDDPSSAVADIGAIILEPIQGHDGWIVPPPEFLPRIREICTRRKLLLIADEIITGFGRTGRWFAVDHGPVIPDIIIVAKGMAGGFPISGIVAREDIMNAWPVALHSSTFLGNPLGCAACLAAIAEIQDRHLVERSLKKGRWLRAQFEEMQKRYPLIGDVRGVGLMLGVELVKDRETKTPAGKETADLVDRLQAHGIIVNQGGKFDNVLKLSPPLVISDAQLQKAVMIIESCLSTAAKRR